MSGTAFQGAAGSAALGCRRRVGGPLFSASVAHTSSPPFSMCVETSVHCLWAKRVVSSMGDMLNGIAIVSVIENLGRRAFYSIF